MNIKVVYFGESEIIFDNHVKMAFVLTSTVKFNNWTLLDIWGIICIYVVKNKGQFTYSKCKVADLSWFAHFGMRIGGGPQLLSCSHLVDHTSISLIFQVNLIGQTSFLGDKTWYFLCITSFNCYNVEIQRVIYAPPWNILSFMFQGPIDKSHCSLKTCPWKFHEQHWVKCT